MMPFFLDKKSGQEMSRQRMSYAASGARLQEVCAGSRIKRLSRPGKRSSIGIVNTLKRIGLRSVASTSRSLIPIARRHLTGSRQVVSVVPQWYSDRHQGGVTSFTASLRIERYATVSVRTRSMCVERVAIS